MTENQMIWAMWKIIGNIPVSRQETMGRDLYNAVHDYLYEEFEDSVDITDEEATKKARETREKKKKEQAAKKIEQARKILQAAGEL